MLLALDIGNTNITIGLLRNGALIATRRAATVPRATADELEVLLDGLLHLDGASFGDVDAIACASVVPALTAHVEEIAASRERLSMASFRSLTSWQSMTRCSGLPRGSRTRETLHCIQMQTPSRRPARRSMAKLVT